MNESKIVWGGCEWMGPYEYSDGSVYQGQMNKQNEKHGKGRLLFKDGGLYEGYFKNNRPFGYCRLIKANGDIYEGMNWDYKAHGRGVYKELVDHNYPNVY